MLSWIIGCLALICLFCLTLICMVSPNMHLAELYCRLYFPCHLVWGHWAGGAIWQMYLVNWTTLVAPALAWLYVTLAVCFGLAQLYVAVTSACMSIKQVLGGVALVSVTNFLPSRLLVVGGHLHVCLWTK